MFATLSEQLKIDPLAIMKYLRYVTIRTDDVSPSTFLEFEDECSVCGSASSQLPVEKPQTVDHMTKQNNVGGRPQAQALAANSHCTSPPGSNMTGCAAYHKCIVHKQSVVR